MNRTLLILTICFVTACSSKPHAVEPIEGTSESPNQTIYVVSHGWHTGFVIPAEEISAQLPQLRERFPDTSRIEFGWGDKGFYQAKEITSGLTLRAIFSPTESVVHAVAVPGNVEQYFSGSDVKELCLEGYEYESLISFLIGSFGLDENGKLVALKNGIYGDSQFYQGTGDYYLMNTCNKWTAKGLKSAGFDVSPTFKLTADSVMDFIDENIQSRPNVSCN